MTSRAIVCLVRWCAGFGLVTNLLLATLLYDRYVRSGIRKVLLRADTPMLPLHWVLQAEILQRGLLLISVAISAALVLASFSQHWSERILFPLLGLSPIK